MDEYDKAQAEYEAIVFGTNPFEEKPELLQQLWDEEEAVPGCYRVVPAPTE